MLPRSLIIQFFIIFIVNGDKYENYTCNGFGDKVYLNTTYDISMDIFKYFWTSESHWFNQFRTIIKAAEFSFPILEATGWIESKWDSIDGYMERELRYDIDPQTAFITTSHVNESQIMLDSQEKSLVFLRILRNEGFPFADTFQVEFLLCAEEIEGKVQALVQGRIQETGSLYWLVKSTVEGGVESGAVDYYHIFDFAFQKWLTHSLKSMSAKPKILKNIAENELTEQLDEAYTTTLPNDTSSAIAHEDHYWAMGLYGAFILFVLITICVVILRHFK